MQMSDNIIQFDNKFAGASSEQEKNPTKESGFSTDVITFSKKKLFKNASLVDILKDDCSVVDILVEKDKIKKIAPPGEIKRTPEMEVHDLEKAYVLPAFWNYYARFDNLLGAIQLKDKDKKEFSKLCKEACRMANFLAGNTIFLDVENTNSCLIENILDYDEKELEKLSDEAAKKNKIVFLHVGLSLEELGGVEKKFGKPLVQVLEDFGFLDRKWVLVGGNCLEKDDFQLLSQYDGLVVICPLEDALVGRRTLNISMLKFLDMDFALGSGQSIEMDFFEAGRHLLSTQRALFENSEALCELDVLMMATFGKNTLEEGDKAHFIVMRNEPTMRESLISYLLWESSKHGPLLTVADGDVLQFEGFIFNNDFGMNYYDVLEKLNEMKEKQKNDN